LNLARRNNTAKLVLAQIQINRVVGFALDYLVGFRYGNKVILHWLVDANLDSIFGLAIEHH
jgi:hypothetical protein